MHLSCTARQTSATPSADSSGGTDRDEDSNVPTAAVLSPFTWLPAPVPAALLSTAPAQDDPGNGKLYVPYEALVGYAPDYSHAPLIQKKAVMQVNQCKAFHPRHVNECQDCHKPRGVFAEAALKKVSTDLEEVPGDAALQLSMARSDDLQYV